VLFIELKNDGYSLGAQRTKITGSEIPEIIETIKEYKINNKINSDIAFSVSKTELLKDDCSLAINKYKTAPNTTHTTTKTALPNNGYKISNTTKTTDNFDGSFSLFKDTKYIDEYGIERTVYGKPEFVQINGTKGQGMQVTIDTPVLKNNTTMNMRQTFNAKY